MALLFPSKFYFECRALTQNEPCYTFTVRLFHSLLRADFNRRFLSYPYAPGLAPSPMFHKLRPCLGDHQSR